VTGKPRGGRAERRRGGEEERKREEGRGKRGGRAR